MPSQMRYVQYYERCISSDSADVYPRRVILDKITMHSIPSFTKGGCSMYDVLFWVLNFFNSSMDVHS